ncbi:MAG TPA: GAF domain-containing protein [Terriglobales bacterium]|nr:GAF domain-containing protein [Terriglobales bacterium]
MAATKPIRVSEKDRIDAQISRPEFDSQSLDAITRSAQYATGASGAALVLSHENVMSCRACSGELGPPVGTRLNADTGFTATCVRTAEVVRCDDTQTDPRVDGSSCVELGIRSILAVPIFNAQDVAGVLEVLSNEPKKFTDRHAAALQLLARLVESLADYVSRPQVSPGTIEMSAKSQSSSEAGKATKDQTKLTCLSCGHPNPQSSQFCNSCGVVLFSFLGPQDSTVDSNLSESKKSSTDEGVKEICEIISGNAGPATWNEISKRLLADQHRGTVQDKPRLAAKEQTTKDGEDPLRTSDDTVLGSRTTERTTGVKARLGAAVRRNLWL